jgi:putative tryptophan/tyrosine transport system substrate-binding protein
MLDLRRRELVALLGSAMAWPLMARAQHATTPVVGFLDSRSAEVIADRLRAFRQGLKETGYIEGENVAVEYRWADHQIDRLPMLAAELVQRKVALIAAPTTQSAMAAKAATTTIPVVFATGSDPVASGLVASLARPGGNMTGVNFLNNELVAKQLDFLRELLPAANRVAAFVNPANIRNASAALADLELTASTRGLQIQVLNASTSGEIEAGFASFLQERPDALFVSGDGLFTSRRIQLVQLATFHRVPTIFANRDFAEVGGLMSYGTNLADAWRQVGLYVGRILKGTKPADLPVVQPSKFELIINGQTARMLGLIVPPTLLATADEVIE